MLLARPQGIPTRNPVGCQILVSCPTVAMNAMMQGKRPLIATANLNGGVNPPG